MGDRLPELVPSTHVVCHVVIRIFIRDGPILTKELANLSDRALFRRQYSEGRMTHPVREDDEL